MGSIPAGTSTYVLADTGAAVAAGAGDGVAAIPLPPSAYPGMAGLATAALSVSRYRRRRGLRPTDTAAGRGATKPGSRGGGGGNAANPSPAPPAAARPRAAGALDDAAAGGWASAHRRS